MVVPVGPGSTVLFLLFHVFFLFLQIKSCLEPEVRPNLSSFHTFSLTWSHQNHFLSCLSHQNFIYQAERK